VSRQAMDEYSLESHRRAVAATRAGRFDYELVPVLLDTANGGAQVVADEAPRPDASAEKLAALRPAFSPRGLVTAGNAPGLADGAAAVVLAESGWADRQGLELLARVTGYATAAVAPGHLFEAPELAIRQILDRTGM